MCCGHFPECPSADASDRDAARVTASHPEQGWSLLCNGVVLFEDTGELLPNGAIVAPRRSPENLTRTRRSVTAA
jgi:hypothetical protein